MTTKHVIPMLGELPPDQLVNDYYNALSRFWQPAATVHDLDKCKIVESIICANSVVIAKIGTEYAAFENTCRHFQAKLSLGEIDIANGQPVIRCKYHGWAYDLGGKCIHIPQLIPGGRIPEAARIKRYLTKVAHGIVWVCLGDKPERDIPEIPELNIEGMHATAPQVNPDWNTSVVRMIMSAFDDYHFPWLHEGVLGERSAPFAPTRTYSEENTEIVSRFSVDQPANVTNSADREAVASRVDYEMRVSIPNVLILVKRSAADGIYAVWFAAKAELFNKTTVFWKVIRNYELDDDERILKFENEIQAQDIPVVGSQRPWLSTPLPLRDVDGALVRYLDQLRANNIPNNI